MHTFLQSGLCFNQILIFICRSDEKFITFSISRYSGYIQVNYNLISALSSIWFTLKSFLKITFAHVHTFLQSDVYFNQILIYICRSDKKNYQFQYLSLQWIQSSISYPNFSFMKETVCCPEEPSKNHLCNYLLACILSCRVMSTLIKKYLYQIYQFQYLSVQYIYLVITYPNLRFLWQTS